MRAHEIMMLLMFAVLLSLLFSARPAKSADFIQYSAPDGALSFTDDPKRVPEAAVIIRQGDFAELDVPVTRAERPRHAPHRWSQSAPRITHNVGDITHGLSGCGPVVITRERLTRNGFNRPYYISRDRCGVRIVSEKVPVLPTEAPNR